MNCRWVGNEGMDGWPVSVMITVVWSAVTVSSLRQPSAPPPAHDPPLMLTDSLLSTKSYKRTERFTKQHKHTHGETLTLKHTLYPHMMWHGVDHLYSGEATVAALQVVSLLIKCGDVHPTGHSTLSFTSLSRAFPLTRSTHATQKQTTTVELHIKWTSHHNLCWRLNFHRMSPVTLRPIVFTHHVLHFWVMESPVPYVRRL